MHRSVLDIYNLFGLIWAKKNTEAPENSANPKPLFLFIVESFFGEYVKCFEI